MGRVAVVTGGGTGIGRVVARRLLVEGAGVALIARRAELLERAAKELEAETGGRAIAAPADTTDTPAIRAAASRVAEHYGRIDILVNGAAAPGGLVRNGIEEADPDLLLADLDTKVVGYFRCVQACVPFMGRGSAVVNIGGLTARSSRVLSGMRNVAIVHLTKALSDQLGPRGITVNTIHPGVVDTGHTNPGQSDQDMIDQTPILRAITPEEIASLVCFLASRHATGITGESLAIDGGLSRGIFL